MIRIRTALEAAGVKTVVVVVVAVVVVGGGGGGGAICEACWQTR